MTTTVTVQRALASLKTLDRKIDNLMPSLEFISVSKGSATNEIVANESISVEEKKEQIKTNYQSLIDLLSQKEKIKSAIILSNAITTVKIGDAKMTVAEAINKKHSIIYKQQLLSYIKQDLTKKNKLFSSLSQGYEEALNKAIENYTANTSNKNVTKEQLGVISQPINERFKPNKIDPLNISKKVEDLSEEISTFIENVDFALSESNSITKINI